MKPHVEVARRNSERGGDRAGFFASEIDATESLGVRRAKPLEEAHHAGARRPDGLDRSLVGEIGGVGGRVRASGITSARAMMIGDRVAKDAMEPGACARRVVE